MPSQHTVMDPYARDAQRYDELLAADGAVRPHWRALIDRLEASGPEAMRRGAELARRLIIENGVTYNVYADPQGRDRPWGLDTLPLILPAAQWRSIEAGIIQRARLLDALLEDLYGAQQLFREGILPPEIAFGHPNYLWPCQHAMRAGSRRLYLYAADLARAPDGSWWVLGDRTQTPSGPGYALENRRIITRVLPELLNDLDVRSLGGVFVALRDELLAGVQEGEAPLAVVLTPGPFNETYFEHAYLAGQLGFPLVEGSDLTVRGDTLYLKTLAGLRRVHAVLRRLDDDFCDPAELRADSALGVPGLLQVVRAGKVVLANALGTGVLESAAWHGFLPSASMRLLGEELQLPSVATWWCGERPALEEVLENLDRLVVKPTFPNQRFEPVFGRELTRDARALLIRRLRARPYAYVAQERVSLSQAPVWKGSGLSGRAMAVRVYAVATKDGYQVLPGGLARIASDSAADIVSHQRGGSSKDVWILPEAGAVVDSAESSKLPRYRTRGADLPSRMGENLYWMGRYAVRCEDKTRLLRAALGIERRSEVWPLAVQSCRSFGVFKEPAALEGARLFDVDNPLGVAADLQRLQSSATEARGRLSSEHWRAIGVLQRQFHDAKASNSDARETLDRLVLSFAGLAGFALDDMAQDEGWHLMMLGRRLERVSFLSTLLALRLIEPSVLTRRELDWLLEIANATIAYRTRYLDRPRLSPVLHLLITDSHNARSLAFQARQAAEALEQLSQVSGVLPSEFFQQAALDSLAADFAALEGSGSQPAAARQEYAARLEAFADAGLLLSDRLSKRHFSHTPDLHVLSTWVTA